MSLLLDDLKTYFRQFPMRLAMGYSLARIAARVGDGTSAMTYSQFGEDRLLPLFLDSKRSGFYVDVGANHPTKCSNTFWLYKRGWTGITVEPNPALSKLHRQVRPRDIQVRELVSDSETDLEFVEFANPLFSSASQEHVETWKDASAIVSRRQVKPQSLTKILEGQACPASFDLLCIDAEGSDLSVLRSLDWSKYHPGIVVVEMADFIPNGRHPILTFMEAHDYTLKAFDGYNGYFQHHQPATNPEPKP
jgi:FkbM family methyltransferase